ncbi:TetR/AcrR family transcriptional regulator [Leekyejoonella antrihumi]|uniref:TetR family transcriptional regulator n=1 Tax=Leekyejoonella antrihumi TaxID=1660198 RepID=A0A563E241_9MICO|nr:TetR/AcrR family transcriptional regulator [Leekyejoonella antrihumi]TWP36618.1 TetR family transcriptional regulator [Leekyejoonella antrihumi]
MTNDGRDGDRRAQLLKAAARVIAERGFAETRLADIAVEVGVSAPLIVYYFGTRERLLIEALRYTEDCFYEVVSSRLAAVGTAHDKLVELLLVSCSPEPVMDLPQGWALWFELWSQAARNTQAAGDRAELDARWRATVARIVRDGQASGELTVDLDAERFAYMLTALLDGLAVQIALNDESVTPSFALELGKSFCTLSLGIDLMIDPSRF